MHDKLLKIQEAYEALSTKLADPSIYQDQKEYTRLAKEHASQEALAEKAKQYLDTEDDIAAAKELASEETNPAEHAALQLEISTLETQLASLEDELKIMLVPGDPNDDKDTISLSGNYNDTIHVGNRDVVNPGGGDNLLIGWDSSNRLILDTKPNSVSFDGSNLILTSRSSNNTLTGMNSNIEVVIDTDSDRYVARFADSINPSIKVESGNYYLFGDSSDNVLNAVSSATTLWGGGGNDTLIGGTGADVFRFTAFDDNVTIQNGDSNDTVSIDFDFSDVSNYEFTNKGVVLSIGNSSLNVVGSDLTTFTFSDGVRTADFSNQSF